MKLSTKARAAKALLKARLFRSRTPLSVYLSVTDRCVFRCAYCNIPNRKATELDTAQLLTLIRGIREAGATRLQFVGGEPMLRKDFGELVCAAKEAGLYVTMSSMGYLIPDKIEELLPMDMVFLSFDGDRAVHDSHKGKGTFDRLMTAMDLLRKDQIAFSTTTLITRKSAGSIDFILATARVKGFQTVFQPLYYTQTAYPGHFHLDKVGEEFLLSNEENRAVFNKLLQAKKAGAPIASSVSYLTTLAGWKDFSKIYSSETDPRYSCWAGNLYCYVDTDGKLYPCGDSIGVVPGVDTLSTGFKAAFRALQQNKSCQSCIVACDLEQNLMFSLNPGTLFNWLRRVG